MGKYLKLFETHSEYNTYINGNDKVLPNVSLCEDNNEVHYNPIEAPETRVIAKLNVIDTSKSVFIIGIPPSSYCWAEKIEIDDGTVIDSPTTGQTHIFSTLGEHTLYYTSKDNRIGYAAFGFYVQGESGNWECSVIIPDNIDTFGPYALNSCNITSLTCLATTPPTLDSYNPLPSTSENFIIYVPAESVNTYKSASGWSNYASKIQAIPSA